MNSYVLAPDFTYRAGGAIRIGNIIADPFSPERVLSSLDPSLPSPEIVTTVEPGRSFSWGQRRSLEGSVWEAFLPRGNGSSGAVTKDEPIGFSKQYTMGSLETLSLQYAPTDDYAAERMRDKQLQRFIRTRLRMKKPLYIVTGVKIAKGFRLEEHSATSRGQANAMSLESTEGLVFAYQLHVIAEHGWFIKRLSVKIYQPEHAFFKDTELLDNRQIITCSFRSLQLTRIEFLQNNIIKLQIEATRHRDELPEALVQEIASALTAYGNAIRDYEMLALNAAQELPGGAILAGDLEIVRREIIQAGLREHQLTPQLLRSLGLLESLHNSEAGSDLGLQGSADLKALLGLLGFRELDTVGRKLRVERKAYSERLIMGLFGGLALIGPMLIMVLKRSQTVSLVTVSVATIIFSLFLAQFARDLAGKDVLGATAAYAAVLVVFVGASS